ncbi:hypothetical protein UA08_03513 [Talaromyces atroroseus]|uniref:Uncharacterized protein n=1 Tax=Talaromyces atroroseus TaxID=1441469 RepID=A0A225AJ76_TALAT|nr:hypothetical protein UA08_03513 [Talaromyces atroroseus]OKL61522.1 hypothetical protein UA08_03513 [Talaromyces atroroseus]
MVKSWKPSWLYRTARSSSPGYNEGGFKDSYQRDSGDETESLTSAPYQYQQGEEEQTEEICAYRFRKYLLNSSIIATIVATFIFIGLFISLGLNHNNTKENDENTEKAQYIVETHVSSPSKTNKKPHLCGTSAAQARELGCTFNQLTWAWLPPNCPSYENEQFLKAEGEERQWVFYEDLAQTRVVGADAWEQVLDGELMVFGETREHLTHCVLRFLSISQIIRDGTPYYEKLVEYKHSKHCADLLLETLRTAPGWNDLQTLAATVSFDQYCDEPK